MPDGRPEQIEVKCLLEFAELAGSMPDTCFLCCRRMLLPMRFLLAGLANLMRDTDFSRYNFEPICGYTLRVRHLHPTAARTLRALSMATCTEAANFVQHSLNNTFPIKRLYRYDFHGVSADLCRLLPTLFYAHRAPALKLLWSERLGRM